MTTPGKSPAFSQGQVCADRGRRVRFVCAVILAVIVAGRSVTATQTAATLSVTLRAPNSRELVPSSIPLEVVFKNTGLERIRILNEFDTQALPVFFGFRIVDQESRLVPVYVVARFEPSRRPLRYSELASGEEAVVSVQLDKVLSPSRELPPGDYEVSVLYRNSTGEDCFRGQILSAPIRVSIQSPLKP